MKVLEYLNGGYSLSDLKENFHIKVREHKSAPLVSLSYSVDSPMNEEIVQECRGLVLESFQPYNIVAYPFKKFFNYNEPMAANVNFSSALATEKLDGTLCIMYWYDIKGTDPRHTGWQVATTSTPDASGSVHNDTSITFDQLFWDIFFDTDMKLPVLPRFSSRGKMCYMFELTSPLNRIIVGYGKPKLTLIGARNLDTLVETERSQLSELAAIHHWPLVESVAVRESIDTIVARANSRKPDESEGMVVTDRSFNRVKVKSLRYIQAHKLWSNQSDKAIVEMFLRNKPDLDELLAYVPKLKESVERVQFKLNALVTEVCDIYNGLDLSKTRKELAAEILKYKASGIVFKMYGNKPQVKQKSEGTELYVVNYIRNMPAPALMELLGD